MTDRAKRVVQHYRDGRLFSLGQVRSLLSCDRHAARRTVTQLLESGHAVHVEVGAARNLYRLTVHGQDLGNHLHGLSDAELT